MNNAILNRFQAIFKGNEKVYGVFVPGEKSEPGQKQGGKAWTESKPLSFSHYADHINGRKSLGVSPIFQEKFVVFSVIDVDRYAMGVNDPVLNRIKNLGLPLLPFRSKSGGLHLYQFFSEPTEARRSIDLMKNYLLLLGLGEKTEIFPKQAYLKGGKKGNWINLPYFGEEGKAVPSRHMIGEDGEGLPLATAIHSIDEKSCTIETALEIVNEIPLNDGPPCLQEILISRDLGENEGRNNFFFSLGRYWKAKDQTRLEEELLEANKMLIKPLDEEEMEDVIKSATTSEASYLCNHYPLKPICKKSICKTRQYGIGNDRISNFSFGLLKKFNSDPPSYLWDIDGKDFQFDDEESILSQTYFRKQSVRHLARAPKKIKEDAWTDIINSALANMEVVEVDMDNDFSAGALFRSYLVEFLEYRGHVSEISQLSLGGVFKDEDSKSYVFKVQPFYEFLIDVKKFRAFSPAEIRNQLNNKYEAKAIKQRFAGKQVRAWVIPFSVMAPIIETVSPDVDFTDTVKELRGNDGEEF
jgi:hypothetical protein